MNISKLLSIACVGAVASAIASQPAQAINFSIGGTQAGADGYVSGVEGAVNIDFNDGTAPTSGPVTYSGLKANSLVQGSKGGQHATPAGDSTQYLTISKTSANVPGNTGSVTLNFAEAADYFGLYWGSVDTYNYIDFYSGDTLLKTFGGAEVSQTARGSWTGATDNIFVNFFADANETFDKVVLRSTGVAFESDNHTYRTAAQDVPEPASVLGLLAIGGLVAGKQLKSKAA